jgi:hypothetical protein
MQSVDFENLLGDVLAGYSNEDYSSLQALEAEQPEQMDFDMYKIDPVTEDLPMDIFG